MKKTELKEQIQNAWIQIEALCLHLKLTPPELKQLIRDLEVKTIGYHYDEIEGYALDQEDDPYQPSIISNEVWWKDKIDDSSTTEEIKSFGFFIYHLRPHKFENATVWVRSGICDISVNRQDFISKTGVELPECINMSLVKIKVSKVLKPYAAAIKRLYKQLQQDLKKEHIPTITVRHNMSKKRNSEIIYEGEYSNEDGVKRVKLVLGDTSKDIAISTFNNLLTHIRMGRI